MLGGRGCDLLPAPDVIIDNDNAEVLAGVLHQSRQSLASIERLLEKDITKTNR